MSLCKTFSTSKMSKSNMSTTDKLVKFQYLVHKLTDSEVNQFSVSLVARLGRNAILSPFCNQFYVKPTKNNDITQIDCAMDIVNGIIMSRSKSISNHSSTKIKLDTLPTSIIGEIASYFYQKQYISFSQCNRSIYIGCNSPNTLRRLDLERIKDYSCIKLQKYSQLRELKVKLSKFHQLSSSANGAKLTHLKKLLLHGESQTNVDMEPLTGNIIFKNIIHLTLQHFGSEQSNVSTSAFTNILSKFSNVEFLQSKWCEIDAQHGSEFDVKTLLPKLKGFSNWSCNSALITNKLLAVYGDTIKIWQDFNESEDIIIPSSISFTNLEEIILDQPSATLLNTISDKASTLRVLRLQDASSNGMDKVVWREYLQKVFVQHQSLEYLRIHEVSYDDFVDICDGIEHALYRLERKQKELQLIIRMGSETTKVNASDAFNQLARITERLMMCQLEDFRLKMNHKGTMNGSVSEEMDKFQSKYQKVTLSVLEQEDCIDVDLIVQNKNCKIVPFMSYSFD